MAAQYIYHWDRIFGALALVVFLLAALGYGLYVWLVPQEHAVEVAHEAVPAVAPTQTDKTPAPVSVGAEPASNLERDAAIRPSEDPSHPQASTEPEEVAETSVEVIPKEAELTAPSVSGERPEDAGVQQEAPSAIEAEGGRVEQSAILAEKESGAPIDSAPIRAPEEVTTALQDGALSEAAPVDSAARGEEGHVSAVQETEEARPDGVAVKEHDETDPVSGREAEAVPPKSVFSEREKVVVSDLVERFTLASGIRNREPVPGIDGLRFDSNGLATVYAFSEVAGLRDSSIFYRWLHEGREIAVVKIRVGGDRWRSHSSKYIKRTMAGEWSVLLTDAEGQRLAQAAFVIAPQAAVDGD